MKKSETSPVPCVPTGHLAKFLLLVLNLLGALPLGVRRTIGRGLGRLVAVFARRERRIADLQLRAFLKVPTPPSAAAVFASIGECALESINLRPILERADTFVRGPDWDRINELTTAGRPILALSAHVGNWDLLAAYFASRGIRVAAVGREARSPDLQIVLENLRQRAGFETIWRSGSAGLKAIISVFRDKGILAALIDQDTSVASRPSPFFGQAAKTPDSLIELAQRSDAIIVSAFLTREPEGGYRIWVEKMDPALDIDGILAEYHRRLERLITAYPDQWVWFHKRWRTRPDGNKLSGRSYESFLEQLARPPLP